MASTSGTPSGSLISPSGRTLIGDATGSPSPTLVIPSITGSPPPQSPTGQPPITPTPVTPYPNVYESPGGQITGRHGYTLPDARILPVLVQALAPTLLGYAVSPVIPFPFIIRWALYWAPSNAPGGTSDGRISLAVGPDPTPTQAGYLSAVNILAPWGPAQLVFCPQPLLYSPLWQPWPEGHNYIHAEGASLASMTNIVIACAVGITPMADLQEV